MYESEEKEITVSYSLGIFLSLYNKFLWLMNWGFLSFLECEDGLSWGNSNISKFIDRPKLRIQLCIAQSYLLLLISPDYKIIM